MTEATDRNRIPSFALIFGSPCVAAAVSLSVLWLAGRWSLSVTEADIVLVWANTALAVVGSGAGGWLIPGEMSERLAGIVLSAAVGFVVHAAVVVAGALAVGF